MGRGLPDVESGNLSRALQPLRRVSSRSVHSVFVNDVCRGSAATDGTGFTATTRSFSTRSVELPAGTTIRGIPAGARLVLLPGKKTAVKGKP
jgi:hypothetical protein